MLWKRLAVGAAGVALIAGAALAAAPAMAETVKYDSWIESDDPAPFEVTQGLVFYKAASINFGRVDRATEKLVPLVPLAELDGLAYTVEDSTSYAPSYQISVVSASKGVTYARLVWEPYQQTPALGEKHGTYADLEDGVWWGNRVFENGTGKSPFGDGDGSQSKPQPLSFFEEYFGDDAMVSFFGVKQGTTTDSTSTVSALTFEGQQVPLGNADKTPFTADELDSAVAKATIDARVGYVNTADAAKAKWNLVDRSLLVNAQNDAATAKAKLVSISGTEAVGHTVKAVTETISGAQRTYKWYVGGKYVSSKSSLKLTTSHGGKSLWVKITTSWTDDLGAKHSVGATAKYRKGAHVAR